MMRTRSHDLALALRHYLAGAEEDARLQAYQVARDGMAAGVSLLDLVAHHEEALAIVLSQFRTPDESVRAVTASAELLAESLGPFEMAHRGFQEANETLARVNANLEREVADRRDAENAARLARAEAERANNAKSEFLSRMSHELRTPLNAVLGFAQLLGSDELSADQRESVVHIEKAGRHLLDLINEVLDIARIEAGQLTLSIAPVAANEVLQEAIDLVRPLAARGEVELSGQDGDARYVLADRQRLRQVLLNLLSNAIKYNRQGGTVIMSWEEVPDRLQVRISDTGPGIDPDKMDRLFSPFDRLGAEDSGVEGVGLGLALSRRLVEAMGGRLEAQSQIGIGSTFTVELPLARPNLLEERANVQVSPQPGEVSAATGSVLCIEDNAANLTLVERALRSRPGIDLLTATRAGLGLELARERHPALILLDMQLPDMSGEEVLRLLRADAVTREIPVLAVSADATPTRIEGALAAGANDYLTKPIDLSRLLEMIDGFLAGSTKPRA